MPVSYTHLDVYKRQGVAAINAGGVTIHSFFQLPLGPQVPEYAASHGASEISSAQRAKRFFRFARNKINLIRTLDLLVIDEISMAVSYTHLDVYKRQDSKGLFANPPLRLRG